MLLARLVDKMDYDISPTRAAIERLRRALVAARWGLTFCLLEKVIALTTRICPPTSSGNAGRSAQESATWVQSDAS